MTQRIVDSGIPFDGIVAFNDQLALGALFTLAANDIAVPDRVQVSASTTTRKPHISSRR